MGIYSRGFVQNRYKNYQPVSKFISPAHIANFCTAEEAVQLINHLENYSGTYPLMIELRDKYNARKGHNASGLSEKQWSIVKKNKSIETPQQPFRPTLFPFALDIVINKSAAFSHFKKKLGMKYGIFTLKVHSIENVVRSKSGNHYKLTMNVTPNTNGTVSVCRMCGKALTDHTSITTGIGPFCAKRLKAAKAYKSDVKKFMEDVKIEFDKIGITQIEVWDSQIVEGVLPIMTEIENHFNKPVKVEHVTVLADHIDWLPIDRCFVVTRSMNQHSDVQQLYNVLKSNEVVYVNIINPKTTNWVKFVRTIVDSNKHIFKPCDPHSKVDNLIVKY